MSITVKTTDPLKIIKPPRAYPKWLAATFTDPNSPVPESVLAENRLKIEPWITTVATPGQIVGPQLNPAAMYMPPPFTVSETPMTKVIFRVLNITDRPIFGFGIRANDKNLVTNSRGEAILDVYPGHNLTWSTGRESGWTIPNGAKRKLRMTGMVPMAQTVPIGTTTTILLYPESGEYRLNGRTYAQPIRYTTS